MTEVEFRRPVDVDWIGSGTRSKEIREMTMRDEARFSARRRALRIALQRCRWNCDGCWLCTMVAVMLRLQVRSTVLATGHSRVDAIEVHHGAESGCPTTGHRRGVATARVPLLRLLPSRAAGPSHWDQLEKGMPLPLSSPSGLLRTTICQWGRVVNASRC